MSDNTSKPTNPKDAIGSNKIPMHLWPETATVLGALGLLDGALKYGRSNFREIGVRASIYYDAAKRHLNAWFEGEECDPDSKLPHLAHALACIAIIVDAEAAGKLDDDRMVQGGYRGLVDELTPHVARLKELHAEKAPKHYTIADSRAHAETEASVPKRELAWNEGWKCACGSTRIYSAYTPEEIENKIADEQGPYCGTPGCYREMVRSA